jgi:hypothetical protein
MRSRRKGWLLPWGGKGGVGAFLLLLLESCPLGSYQFRKSDWIKQQFFVLCRSVQLFSY